MNTGDELKNVRAGDPLRIAAGAWNATMDTVRWRRSQQRGQEGSPNLGPLPAGVVLGRPDLQGTNRCAIVPVHDGQFSVDTNKASAPLLVGVEQFRSQEQIFNCIGAPNPGKPWGVTLEQCAGGGGTNGGIVRVLVAGTVNVIVNITDLAHHYADVDPGSQTNRAAQTNLVSCNVGYAKILFPGYGGGGLLPSTGTQWCTVLLGPEQATFSANITTDWATGKTNLLIAACGVDPGATTGGGGTIRVALNSPAAATAAVPPPNLTIAGNNTSFQWLPFREPRPLQGTNKVDGLALGVLGSGACFVVSLSQTGGGGGGPGAAGFTYTMSALNGQVLATSIGPAGRTHAPGTNAASAATLGIGYCDDGTGTYKLAIAFES